MGEISTAAFLLDFLPDRSVDLFVERWTTGWVLAKWMILGTHQIRAIGECAADLLPIQRSMLFQMSTEIGMGQSGTANSDDGALTVADVCRSGVHRKVL
jgi:hypothetical protein